MPDPGTILVLFLLIILKDLNSKKEFEATTLNQIKDNIEQ